VEGQRSAGELLTILQNVVEEQSASLIARRQQQEARDLDCRLREEQDEAYRIGLLADQVCIFYSFLLTLLKPSFFFSVTYLEQIVILLIIAWTYKGTRLSCIYWVFLV
jgi:hypothetical protein